METSVSERIKCIFNEYRVTETSFARQSGIKQVTLNRQLKGESQMAASTINAVLQAFPQVSSEWLLRGNGDMLMLKDTDTDNRVTVDILPADAAPEKGGIPFFDREIACGPACDYNASIEASKADGTISLPNIEGDFALIARGDSMIDPEHPDKSIPSGSLVVLKKATDDILRWGEVYALATTDGFLIKKVMPTDDSERIELRSLNASEFPPFCVRKKDVYGVARVVAVVNYRLY